MDSENETFNKQKHHNQCHPEPVFSGEGSHAAQRQDQTERDEGKDFSGSLCLLTSEPLSTLCSMRSFSCCAPFGCLE